MTHRPDTSIESTPDHPLDAPRAFLSEAAAELAPDDVAARLCSPDHSHRIAIPFERDDGTLELFEGFRVRHDDARGSFLGPHRYQPDLSAAGCAGLATAVSVTTAIADVPFGGAAGGVAVDPTTLSRAERDRLGRRYARRITGIGPDADVLVPGVGADARTMAHLADAAADRVDGPARATTTGKPPATGGCSGIGSAAGHGVALATEEALEMDASTSLADASVAVYGSSSVGETSARLLDSWGANVVAVCSDRAGLASADGLDASAVVDLLDEPRAIANADADEDGAGTMIGTENVLERDADALVLASTEPLTTDRARSIEAPIVIEGSYGTITPAAQLVLDERGITVVPDVLANVGGVVAAHLEWVQNVGRDRWSDPRLRNELGYALAAAWEDVRTRCVTDESTLREAAYAVGVERLVDAHEVIR